MEIDIEQWILKAATINMEWEGLAHDKACIVSAFEEMHPEVNIIMRVRQQVKEYKKLTMWRE